MPVGEVPGSARTWAGAAVNGTYVVTAVDLAGKQGPSASVTVGSGGATTTTTVAPTTTVPPATTTTTTMPPSTDTQAPSVPTGLTAAVRKGSRVVLAWNASTDNVGVAGYRVLRNQVVVATVATPGYEHKPPKGTSTCEVVAFDAAGNAAARSALVTVKV